MEIRILGKCLWIVRLKDQRRVILWVLIYYGRMDPDEHGETGCVCEVNGITDCVGVKIWITTGKRTRILAGPPRRPRVVVPRPKPYELRVGIVEPPREAKGLEAGSSVRKYIA